MRAEERSWELLRAMSGIDERFVAEARPCKSAAKTAGKPKHKLRRMYTALLAAALIVAIPTAAWGGSTLYDAVRDKTQDAGLSEEETGSISNDLGEQGFTAQEIQETDPLGKNEEGQTYGASALGAELVAVVDDNGNEGYVYRSELEYDDMQTPEDAERIEKEERGKRVLKVYASDGKTLTGTFTMKNG